MDEVIRYIKLWLCYGDEAAAERVGYTDDRSLWSRYAVVIRPSGLLGQQIVCPTMRPIQVQTIEPTGKTKKKTFIIDEDIIYTAFFFISRAEETINEQRDQHGRFAARYSLLGQQNRLAIPILDEYARVLCKLLDKELPKKGFDHIYLTHDIDFLTTYRHLRGAIGGLCRGESRRVFAAWKDIHHDPAYTFPWLIARDHSVPQAQSVYFVKHTRGLGYDYPQYSLRGKDWQTTEQLLLHSGATLGIHSSYYNRLPEGPLPYTLHRSHYLRCPIDFMQTLADRGITDDFSMGFADCAGFRLQTSRAVRWINPKTCQLTDLTLHPLTVMDCTLSNSNYMNLSEDEAYYYCQQLFDKTRLYHGELCLLWHNIHPGADTYHRSLYTNLLASL